MGFEAIHQPKSRCVFFPCHSVAMLLLVLNSVFFRAIPWLCLILLLF